MVIVANGLIASGVRVSLVLAEATGPYLDLVDPRVRVVNLGARSTLHAVWRLASHLREVRPKALLSAMSHANVVAALAGRMSRSKTRLVLSERVHLASLFAEYRGLRMRVTHALMRLTYPWADKVVTVSHGVAEDLALHVPVAPERIVVIYNPVIDEHLRRQAQADPAHAWLREGDVPVVLAAGRLIAQKDFATLIRAFASLRRQRRARLLILGEGELRASLLALANELGIAEDVALPGFDSNPFSAMRTARVFVLSSRYEGLPGVLIQAMACGARVVSTDCPSGPREVLEDGRWGALAPVGDVAALSAAIAAALDDPNPPDVRARAAAFTAEHAIECYAQVLGVSRRSETPWPVS
jgi:glycosyltransferase involved in cell wall biosynthesis